MCDAPGMATEAFELNKARPLAAGRISHIITAQVNRCVDGELQQPREDPPEGFLPESCRREISVFRYRTDASSCFSEIPRCVTTRNEWEALRSSQGLATEAL